MHTAIETCGYADTSKIPEITDYTDLSLFDYKETDAALHKKYTGVGNESILGNLAAINGAGKDSILRCPIIPGYNDRKEHFDGIAAVANKFEHILHIELEPYHSLGEGKYSALGLEKPVIGSPSAEDKEAWRLAVRSAISCTEIAYRCGFSNAAQFSALYKKIYGIAPQDDAVYLFTVYRRYSTSFAASSAQR